MLCSTGWTSPRAAKPSRLRCAIWSRLINARTTQQAYEQAFARVVNRLIADGYQVLALSTCTSIDRYNRDDRMVALRMAKYVNDSENFHIAMDELNDVEIGRSSPPAY